MKVHAAALTESEKKKFKSEFGYYVCSLPGGQELFNDLFDRNPRQILLMAAYGCLLMIAHNDRTSTNSMLVEALLKHRAKA